MKKIKYKFPIKRYSRPFLLFIFYLLFISKIYAQPCDPLTPPTLFGLSQTAVFCKGISVGFGVSNSIPPQDYVFSVYRNNVEVERKAGPLKGSGPLDGNGHQLSINADIRSAQDAGEYRVTTLNKCGDAASVSFQVFYSDIDNLSITSWGSNAVTFKWAACGPAPAVTYEYAVTDQPDPNSSLINYKTTTDTTATEPALTSGTTYYIHVRINSVVWNNQNVFEYFDCPGGDFPFQTIKFIACSGAATAGTISPKNAVACLGSTTTLSATGGSTYQWYDENNATIKNANTSSYAASSPGEYKVYVTTSAGCEGLVSTATVTQTSLQAGVFSGGSCNNIGDSVKLGISKTVSGQTYIILRDGVSVNTLQGIGTSNESEDTIRYAFKLTSATQYGHYTVRVNNAWCSAIDFGGQDVSSPGTWSGAVDASWQNPLNWKCGTTPGMGTDVIIPAGSPNMPIVNSNVSCKSVMVQSGATLTVASGSTLNITGK